MNLKNLSAKIKIPKLIDKKLKNKRISKLYNNFKKSLSLNDNFIVAVSGGADSLALSFLAKLYSIENNITARYYIVDHKLRSDSTNEAKTVKKVLKKYSINAKILTWKGRKPKQNIQSIARNKRYELIFAECRKFNIKNILLGHHQGDLFENFFIRLTRGSGLKGLISLDKKSKIDNINLIRPLLDQKKEDLVFLSKFIFEFYVDDPTNYDEKYLRIKIRRLMNELNKSGLDQKKFFQTLLNLRSSNSVVNFYVNQNMKKNTHFSQFKKKLILNKDFFIQPHEVILRALSYSIKLVGKKYYSSRGKKLNKLITDINNNKEFKATLGGCIIEKVNQSVIITKEHQKN
tara:strand:- start:441 stop:1478 length:1038 start_codon:yes stop_codon:yes gene_type:complete